ncbi:MAG TPA: glycosyltransferase family 2 protein, partial [Candidatus Saccharimonadia bacterium]|nr:glycosyltransferase family 2 protein [Candidatus Saccharimonadia bacterium]
MTRARRAITRYWLRTRRALSRPPPRRDQLAGEPPLRARLLSAEQMERQGRVLAQSHRFATARAPDRLLERLVDNHRLLDRACDMLAEAVQARRRLTPAGEWLLDNIYLIEEQIRLAQRHLPKGYSRELPRLVSGPSAGFPRVYDIALAAISHGDGRIDADSLSRFVAAYQGVAPLKLGELWAIPIMLRLALIENLRRVSARVIVDRVDRNLAETWADRLTEVAESDPKGLVLVIADMVRSSPPMASPFVAELARRLQGHSAALALPLTWIELWLSDSGHSIEQMVQAENQQQAADQVAISNSIGSIRFFATMDWREFVERMSVVERRLREDPAGTYPLMDFATRDHYRHVVERIAKRGKLEEAEVAARVVRLAQAHADPGGEPDVAAHVGYYLVDDGVAEFERTLGFRRGPLAWLDGSRRPFPLAAYLVPIGTIVAVCTLALIVGARDVLDAHALTPWVALLGIIAFSELGIGLVNLCATLLAPPATLPRLDFSEGIPASARTLVVVPTMFGDAATIAALAESLEVRFLANRDENLRFALLTDFFDAEAETLPGDAALLDAAVREIDALNARHAPERGDAFYLFHRPRVYNERERAWIGYERKRGKLAAMNAFLRGGARSAFIRTAGNIDALGHVRFVITLDTDTRLPRDAARKLAGTLAHPLNRAEFDRTRNCVVRGYGILQPRVGVSMSGQRPTWYARVYGSEPGIDPYSRAVSDVYQDLFGEGSFVGKGIYDVDAFEQALEGRFPENRILSHDLLEGCYARAGLVSDVQLYEDYPARYAVDVKRRHRWIRGDWQLLPWLLPRVAREDGTRERNPLSMLSRGKVLDNLRRSLVPAAMTALLVLGWLFAPAPLQWTAWVLAIVLVPPLLASLAGVLAKPADMPLVAHLNQSAVAMLRNFARAPLTIACLPYEAWFSLDAIARTLVRLVVTRRHLLQWSPSSEVERTLGTGPGAALRAMGFAPLLAIAVALALARYSPAALPVAVPVLLLWLAAPSTMWLLGRSRAQRRAELSPQQLAFLGRVARRTWLFFDTWVGPDDHWLPPDNVQEQPALVVARRTSPTNVGLALLANLSACDFGYLMPRAAIARIGATLGTLKSLARHEGHYYNWYDTETLQPLPPHYISSVDSGNLAGHLLTLRQGLLAMADEPLLPPRTFRGLGDTFGVLCETLGPGSEGTTAIEAFRAALDAALVAPRELAETARHLDKLLVHAAVLVRTTSPPEGVLPSGGAPLWAAELHRQCLAAREAVREFAPWLD